jgi:phosphoribosyl 1,2-cyclic phosphodiesterase
MRLRFWGTRDGVASPSRFSTELGGNTPCVQVYTADDKSILIDSGTGIIDYASRSKEIKDKKEYHIFITHFHWDHIQGFPFFFPIHRKGVSIHLYSSFPIESLRYNISELFDGTYSPLRNLSNLNADIHFHKIDYGSTVNILGAELTTHPVKHIGKCYAYKVKTNDYTLCCLLDNELIENENSESLYNFYKGCDILIQDAQYTASEYKKRIGWGHSSIENAIEFAIKGKVKTLFLSNHDPSHTDDYLILYLSRYLTKLKRKESRTLPIIYLAKENKIYNINIDRN